MIAKGDQRPAADSIHKIFAKVQHKEPCSKKNVLILTNRTDIGHNHLVENPHSKENRLLSGNNSRFRNIGEANCPTNEVLQPSPIMVAVIISVAYNHMVEEVDAHKVASLFEGLCQCIVKLARMDISARVVVDEGQYRGIIQNCLLDNHPHVHAHLSQTTLAHSHLLDEFVVLAEQHHVSFLDGQVLHDGAHILEYAISRRDVGAKSHGGELAALAEFDGGHNLADGVGAHSINLLEFAEVGLAQLGEVAVVP